MSRRKLRGIALISTFLFVGLLFMMAASMVVVSRSRVFTGISQYRQTQAFYLAEAGLAKTMASLETSLEWEDIIDGKIDGMPGTYTVVVDETAKNGSVINIGTDGAANSYRGDETVPINHAIIVVTANVSGHTYVLEAMIKGQGAVGYMSDAILASGTIESTGNLYIDGIAGLDDSSEVDGSLQSNKSSGTELIKWSGDTGETALVKGNVGVGASSSSSISMDGAIIEGGHEYDAVHQIPSYDIENEVDSNSGHTVPTFVSGGTTTLSAGKYTYDGSEEISGDIVLEDGAELYVTGDLTVIGSISGNGSVWVKGDTSFKGDSSVTTNDEFSVALYSQGNVKLTGFDGTAFLNNLDDPDGSILHLLNYTEHAVSEAQTLINSSPDSVPTGALKSKLDEINAGMGFHHHPLDPDDVLWNWWDVSDGGNDIDYGDGVNGGEKVSNAMGLLREEMETLPEGTTRDFLRDRIENLEKFFTSADESGVPNTPSYEMAAIQEFDDGGSTRGLYDAVLDAGSNDHWPQVVNLVNSINYDKPGAAYFQGAIYTKGFFYAANEVNILGAIMVDGNGIDQETVVRQVFDPDTLELVDVVEDPPFTLTSGDCYLGNNTRVTYVEEFFKDDDEDNSGPQNLAKLVWMGR